MTDQRLTTFDSQVQTAILDAFDEVPMPPTPLEALANKLTKIEGHNTFREHIIPFVRGRNRTLTAFRAQTSNNPTTVISTQGGYIQPQARKHKYIDHVIENMYDDGFEIERTAGVDAKYCTPEKLATLFRQGFYTALQQNRHELCAQQSIYSGKWVVPSTASITTAAAITAADTTFVITDALKASSGITAGDLVKIGDDREPDSASGAAEVFDIVLVKTVGGDGSAGGTSSTITIETDTTKFPPAVNLASGSRVFMKLKVALTAHSSGAKVQIDRPTAVTEKNIDNLIRQVKIAASRSNIDFSKMVMYMPPEVYETVLGQDTAGIRSAVLANDFLGKDVLFNGEMMKYRSCTMMNDSNAISRTYGGGTSGTTVSLAATRHYIWVFEKNASFGLGNWLESQAFDKMPGTANLLSLFTYAELVDSVMSYNGSIRSLLVPVTVS